MNRYFILGPVIIALAFTLPYPSLVAIQVVAGVTYTMIGFLK